MTDIGVVLFVFAILLIIIVPLPSGLLDFFLTISLAVAVLILLLSLYIPKPTDFTTFPTIILIVTLYRLSLNVATTRMILSKGYEGPDAVSKIISAFGEFVVGGNYVIGIIIFIILVVINFMVITQGSTRVAEVAARFTLDALPGKQMAIDADLNAGLIDEQEAKRRREELIKEANFYGAMDGASKFVKGDAIAGIIITVVNIIAGFLIGIFQHGMDLAQAASTYTILTVGDGLVGQIPALMVSTATGIIITRATKDESNFAEGVIKQLMRDYKVVIIVGVILVFMAFIPGFPTGSLLFVGGVFLIAGYLMMETQKGVDPIESLIAKFRKKPPPKKESKKEQKESKEEKPKKSPEEEAKEEEKVLEDILKVELIELDIGYQLIKIADPNQGGDLLDRIKAMRKKIAADFGFLVPQIRIKDNLNIKPTEYMILLKGVEVAKGEIYPDKYLAMSTPMVVEEIEGIKVKEPAFGIEALWIDEDKKEEALMNGYTVVDPSTVIVTHLSEIIKKYAEELLTRQDVQALLDRVKKDFPAIVDDALKVANIGLIQRVLKSLLHEKIPIKDMITILETIADVAEYTKNIDVIVEHVRSALSRVITKLYESEDGTLKLVTFDAGTEQYLISKLQQQGEQKQFMLTVAEMNKLVEEVNNAVNELVNKGVAPVVLIVDPLIRKPLAEILERFGVEIVVLSHAEIDPNAKFEVLGSISIDFNA
ncbi:flagellar biosynthesis protein FlhA [Caminibacter pacificus]|uniref:Flagellar biosynthesis protein FlhA n=1 Tax=Caminibacter pacificus TaxID=1424653 RepID=A0ABX5TLU3_9BACT|nr:flagellar biosynthesis protein FlhA [Campylobacterota bacterium]QCI28433.1 flagellar biosynthesis protein FlhA [Caminibacter pacificus]